MTSWARWISRGEGYEITKPRSDNALRRRLSHEGKQGHGPRLTFLCSRAYFGHSECLPAAAWLDRKGIPLDSKERRTQSEWRIGVKRSNDARQPEELAG